MGGSSGSQRRWVLTCDRKTLSFKPFYIKCTRMPNHRVKEFTRRLENLEISDYHGLSSPGLTCYLNSVLQVLFMTEDFREAVKGYSRKHFSTLDPYLGELFFDLEMQIAKTNIVIETLGINNVFKQRDAAEYFEKILCLTSPEASMVFKGKLNHETTCHGCNHKNNSKNSFWVLPLAVEESNDKPFNVQQGLKSFFKVQTVRGENQMYCNSCKKKQNADTGCEMIHRPDVLTLLLKRFTFDYKKYCYVKLKCKAYVGRTLDTQGCRYDLYAIVHHFGDLSGGHYTADIKSFETGEWYCFNDQIVKRVKPQYFEGEDNFIRSHTAYLLMYKKVSGPSKKTECRDPATHHVRSAFMDEERKDDEANESSRGRKDKHLDGDAEASWRKDTSPFDQRSAPVRQRENGLLQHYGTKEYMYHRYAGGISETTRPEWMFGQHHNYEITRTRLRSSSVENPNSNVTKSGKITHPCDHSPTKSNLKTASPAGRNIHCKPEAGVGTRGKSTKPRREDVFDSNVKLHPVLSSASSPPKRSDSANRARELSRCNGSPPLLKKNGGRSENRDDKKPWRM